MARAMPQPRSTRLVCHHCAVTLTRDEEHHYGYECHACVIREHEMILTWQTDPDHPDAERLFGGPADIGLRLAP